MLLVGIFFLGGVVEEREERRLRGGDGFELKCSKIEMPRLSPLRKHRQFLPSEIFGAVNHDTPPYSFLQPYQEPF
jgi:hypothetical protein